MCPLSRLLLPFLPYIPGNDKALPNSFKNKGEGEYTSKSKYTGEYSHLDILLQPSPIIVVPHPHVTAPCCVITPFAVLLSPCHWCPPHCFPHCGIVASLSCHHHVITLPLILWHALLFHCSRNHSPMVPVTTCSLCCLLSLFTYHVTRVATVKTVTAAGFEDLPAQHLTLTRLYKHKLCCTRHPKECIEWAPFGIQAHNERYTATMCKASAPGLGCDCWTVAVPLHFFGMQHHISVPHFGTQCSLVTLGCNIMTPPICASLLQAPCVSLSPVLVTFPSCGSPNLICWWPCPLCIVLVALPSCVAMPLCALMQCPLCVI